MTGRGCPYLSNLNKVWNILCSLKTRETLSKVDDRIVALITLLFKSKPKEATRLRAQLQFIALMRLEKNEEDAPKTKMVTSERKCHRDIQ
jgi:hypothetical protein